MRYSEEDFERAEDLDMMWLLEKEAEMFAQLQEEMDRLPAEVIVITSIPKLDEVQSNSISLS